MPVSTAPATTPTATTPPATTALVAPEGVNHHVFTHLEGFQSLWRQEHRGWAEAVNRGLKRLALAGLQDPLSDQPAPPQRIAIVSRNCRETIEVDGVVSRQRAQLLVLRRLIAAGELPPLGELRCYLNEAITGYADYLRRRCPELRCSEYLPEPDHPLRGVVPHRDVRRLNLPPASMHCLLCNEVLEHVEELPPALSSMAEVLTLGGYLLATVPLAYGQQASIVKAVWRGEELEPELLVEPEFHGDPVNPSQGSLVYRIPGWELLEQLKVAGFRRSELHLISSARYGVLGAELPYVFVLVAQR